MKTSDCIKVCRWISPASLLYTTPEIFLIKRGSLEIWVIMQHGIARNKSWPIVMFDYIHVKKWTFTSGENEKSQIDLFRLYILFSQYKSCNNTQEDWFVFCSLKRTHASMNMSACPLFNEQNKGPILLSISTWFVLGKQNVQAKKVYCPPTFNVFNMLFLFSDRTTTITIRQKSKLDKKNCRSEGTR